MRNKVFDLHLVVLGGLATLALAPLAALRQASMPTPLSGALAAIAALIGVFALLAPGYAGAAAFFPRAPLGVAKRLTYSLGFSFSFIALGGLALNLTPWGLSYTSWALFLGGATLLGSVVALLRGAGRALSLAPLTRWARPGSPALHPRTLRAAALLIVALLGVGGAITLSIAGANQAQQGEQTAIGASLWLLPITHAGVATQARVGVRNLSASETTYRLTLTMNGQVALVWSTLDLRANQTWTTTVNVASLATNGATGSAEQLTATLALANTPATTYRQVTAWVTTPTSASASTASAASTASTASDAGATEKRRLAPSVRP